MTTNSPLDRFREATQEALDDSMRTVWKHATDRANGEDGISATWRPELDESLAALEAAAVELVEQFVASQFGPRCETKDTEDFHELKDGRCAICEMWEVYDEWLAAQRRQLSQGESN